MYIATMLRSAGGMTHGLRSDLWWTIPLRILLGQFWDTFRIPPDQVSPGQTHRCPGAFGSRSVCGQICYGLYTPVSCLACGEANIIHGLCFGFYLSGPLPQRSLLHGPLSRVHFGESLVIRLHSEIDQIHLSSEAQCVSHHLPLVDCHIDHLSTCQLNGQRCQMCVYVFKVTSSGRAEVQHIHSCWVFFLDTLNFISATRLHFFKSKHTFDIYGHSIKGICETEKMEKIENLKVMFISLYRPSSAFCCNDY